MLQAPFPWFGVRGHAFTQANTYLRKRGAKTERFCRECARERDRVRYARKKSPHCLSGADVETG